MTQLNQVALGLTLGILWALGMLLMGVASMFFGYGTEIVDMMGTVYLGAGSGSWVAILLGGVWAFVDGFVCGFLIAWVYNRLS